MKLSRAKPGNPASILYEMAKSMTSLFDERVIDESTLPFS